jgi:protoheme IX farnesyltransferase
VGAESAAQRSKLSAYLELTKPRIVLMVLLTTGVGFWLAARLAGHPLALAATLLGTGLVAGGASAWNQVIERARDARMRRTSRRPLPLGDVSPRAAGFFGTAITALGLAILAFVHPLAALVAFLTFMLYIAVYTPLKLVTTLNTAIGAVPGALPPVIGWAAATGRIGLESWTLFLIVFLWQFPHFLAIAWLHREDYARGGYRMLPSVDPDGSITSRQAVVFALTLIPGGLMPAVIGLAGPWYYLGVLALGFFYVDASFRFQADVSDVSARRLMRASFFYLPLVLLLLILNPLPA